MGMHLAEMVCAAYFPLFTRGMVTRNQIDNLRRRPYPINAVYRSLAAIVLVFWVSCYARCVAEQSGLLGTGALVCCSDEGAQGNHQETDDDTPCGICDGLKMGNLLVSKPFAFACLAFVLAATFVLHGSLLRWVFRRVSVPVMNLRREAPWSAPRLCEWLTCTALPVRGPSLILG